MLSRRGEQDMKFASSHFSDIVPLAMIGETNWPYGIFKPCTKVTVRNCDRINAVEARQWQEKI
jgi:hypothetical protein